MQSDLDIYTTISFSHVTLFVLHVDTCMVNSSCFKCFILTTEIVKKILLISYSNMGGGVNIIYYQYCHPPH